MTAVLSFASIHEIVTLTKCFKDVATFLGIFSLSRNFNYVVDILETVYYSQPLSDMPGTRVGFVDLFFLVNLSLLTWSTSES
jgi:hypothetical protein